MTKLLLNFKLLAKMSLIMLRNTEFLKTVSKWLESKKMKDKSKESLTAPVIISEIWIKISSMLRVILIDVLKSREIRLKECFHFTAFCTKLLRVKLN